jgi:hypothetical protein
MLVINPITMDLLLNIRTEINMQNFNLFHDAASKNYSSMVAPKQFII